MDVRKETVHADDIKSCFEKLAEVIDEIATKIKEEDHYTAMYQLGMLQQFVNDLNISIEDNKNGC